MTITGIISRVGQPREFTTTQNGLEKKQKAIEIQLKSGASEILAELYGEGVDVLAANARVGQLACADVVFNVKEADRRDGSGKMAYMRATIACVNLV